MDVSKKNLGRNYKQFFTDYVQILNCLGPFLKEVIDDLEKLLENIEVFISDTGYNSILDALENENNKLKKNITGLLEFTKQLKQDEVVAREKLKHCRERYGSLFELQVTEQEFMNELQNELHTTQFQLQQQNTYFMKTTLILGQFVYKATLNEEITDIFICTDEIIEFFNFVKKFIEEFMYSLFEELPDERIDEMKIVRIIVRIMINIASHSVGRHFLSTNLNGRRLISAFLNILPKVPLPSGKEILECIITLLFNVSINKNGIAEIKRYSEIWKHLSKIIDKCFETVEYRTVTNSALKLAKSILQDVTEPSIIKSVFDAFGTESMERWKKRGTFQTFIMVNEIKELLNEMKKSSGIINI